MCKPSSIAVAITTIFANVPNPGFWRNGIHSSRMNTEIINVDSPILRGVLSEIPSANTVHGELPSVLMIKNASPRPKIVNPNIRINNLSK
jgi:hypothetical protein